MVFPTLSTHSSVRMSRTKDVTFSEKVRKYPQYAQMDTIELTIQKHAQFSTKFIQW